MSLLTVLALIGVVALVLLLLVLRRMRQTLHAGVGTRHRSRKKTRRRVSAWEESERRLFMNKPAGFAPGSDDDTVDLDASDIGPEDIGPGDLPPAPPTQPHPRKPER